ncbi:MAG: signal peptidase II [Nitrospiraceae bacterium]|nr:signal peptidase II [Nitrospiraceae bacterium]
MKKTAYLFIASAVVMIDQITKYFADNLISPFESVRITPFFHLVNVRNTGVAFGMFKDWGNAVFIIVSIAAIAVIVYMFFKNKEDPLGLSLILSGAAGNLIDRIYYGSVRDFLDFFINRFHWPAFNVADSAITIGIGLIFIKLLRSPVVQTDSYE